LYINWKRRELVVTVALYGPQLSGKTTTWRWLARGAATPPGAGDDAFSLQLDNVRGKQIILNIRDISGDEGQAKRRRVALYGVDGLIFVADSHPDRMEANTISLQELEAHLATMEKSIYQMPFIFQYNKRDLPDAVKTDELQEILNPHRRFHFQETCAVEEEGLLEILKQATDLVMLTVSR
jgi:hypothetical protein